MKDRLCIGFAKERLLKYLCRMLRSDNGWSHQSYLREVSVDNQTLTTRTPTFDLREVGETHLKVQEENGDEGLLRADVAVSGSIVFITVNAEERGYPIIIENASDYDFVLSQAVSPEVAALDFNRADICEQAPAEANRRASEKKYSLNAHQNMPFAWDDPMQEEKLLRLTYGSEVRDIKVMEIGTQMPFKLAVCFAG